MDLVLKIIFGLLGLNIIILIHELGHFIAAKLCGVGVETFSLGWGKKLVGFKLGETNYQLAMFPIGGYCKLKGELFKPDFTEEDFQKAKTDKNSFMGESLWKKIVIVVCGPFASFIFAIVAFAIIYMVGYNIYTSGNRIVLSSDTETSQTGRLLPATAAGFASGDNLLSINGKQTDTFYAISEIISKTKKNESLAIRVKRGNKIIEKTILPYFDSDQDKFIIGITQWIDPIIDKVTAGKPGKAAGLEKGDTILVMNGAHIKNTVDMDRVLRQKPPRISMFVSRNGTIIPVMMRLTYDKSGNADPGIGFESIIVRSPDLGFFGSMAQGSVQTWNLITGIIKGFGRLFSIKINGINDVVAGPVRITMMMGDQAMAGFSLGIGEGFIQFFRFINILSVFISFMNLLPLPAFDGGQAVLSIIMAARKNLSLKFVYRYQLVGFVFIFALLVLAVFSDVFNYL